MTNETHKLFGPAGQKLYTSDQAAAQIGKDRKYLIKLIGRHPELRPAVEVGQGFFWTEGEIEAAAQKKATAKRGRPSTK